MSNDKDWHRPKKPYTVTPSQAGPDAGFSKQAYEKSYDKPLKKYPPKPKQVIVPAKNNANNQVLHECMKKNGIIKVSISNQLSTDKELNGVYEGTLVSFDDFTILVQSANGAFLINKNAILVVEFI